MQKRYNSIEAVPKSSQFRSPAASGRPASIEGRNLLEPTTIEAHDPYALLE